VGINPTPATTKDAAKGGQGVTPINTARYRMQTGLNNILVGNPPELPMVQLQVKSLKSSPSVSYHKGCLIG
jgi:hypothetical protein